MKMIKEVLRLRYSCGLNKKEISKAIGRSRGAVAEYLHRAQAAGLSWPLPDDMDEAQLEQRLFPPITPRQKRPLPDFGAIHIELQKKGATLLQLWAEYREEFTDGYGFTQFCEYYNRFEKMLGLVMRQEHQAGEKCFSDFAGAKLPIVIDQETGAVKFSHLFVCTLGTSNMTFADLFWDETAESWCNAHAAAFSFFGGCPKICVPDNPKAVIIKPCRYEAEVNQSFAQMAAHYDMCVLPARVRKPKDKSKVEAAVGLATRWILFVLRNRTFFSLAEARAAVRELLDKLNDRPFKKITGTRRSVFESIDRPALKPLPAAPYEFRHYEKVPIGMDYHVEFAKHFYSVPFQYRSEPAEIWATSTTVEIFCKGTRIASHARSYIENKNTTLDEHRPKSHREMAQWSEEKIKESANKIGPATLELLAGIIERQKNPEQGTRSCLGILRLAKHFDEKRLESACKRALGIRAFSYKSVKSILTSKFDQLPAPEKVLQLSIVHNNIRGAEAFSPQSIKEDEHANRTDFGKDEVHETNGDGQSPGIANGTEGST